MAPRSTAADLVRAAAVLVLAVLQIVVAGLGGSGRIGDGVGVVAADNPTPLLAAGWAFSIWSVIYLGFLAYAVYAVLPSQRSRPAHRRTGWWLAVSAVLNPLWILAFGNRHMIAAEVVILLLLVVLAAVYGRLSHEPARGTTEQLAFRLPIALYAGWVSLATVLGTAATGVAEGLPGDGVLALAAAVTALLATAAIVCWVVSSATAVVGYAAATVWGLIGIATNDRPPAVGVTALLAAALIAIVTTRRVLRSVESRRVALG
ncbi:tryptophan-rich sensory protein [Pseudonocardia benzenivorans]